MTVAILFYIFAALTILGALLVISARNPVNAVLSLVLTFVSAAGTWLLLHAAFLAMVLVVVYVGAVMVLFLFVVMMLDIKMATRRESFVRYWPLVILIGAVLAAILITTLTQHFGLDQFARPKDPGPGFSSIKQLGQALFTDYLYPFELAAVVLFSAMVAAIALTFRGRRQGTKVQKAAEQIAVDPKARLKKVKMASEPNPEGGEL